MTTTKSSSPFPSSDIHPKDTVNVLTKDDYFSTPSIASSSSSSSSSPIYSTPLEHTTTHEPAEDSLRTHPSTQEDNEEPYEGAITPTGDINWDCPCLQGMAHGPCGPAFREAFSCFVYSKEEPKGLECLTSFQKMQTCFKEHPELYAEELTMDEEEENGKENSGMNNNESVNSSFSTSTKNRNNEEEETLKDMKDTTTTATLELLSRPLIWDEPKFLSSSSSSSLMNEKESDPSSITKTILPGSTHDEGTSYFDPNSPDPVRRAAFESNKND